MCGERPPKCRLSELDVLSLMGKRQCQSYDICHFDTGRPRRKDAVMV
jgi:hypothetical protein